MPGQASASKVEIVRGGLVSLKFEVPSGTASIQAEKHTTGCLPGSLMTSMRKSEADTVMVRDGSLPSGTLGSAGLLPEPYSW